jgi:hypothetical protein
MIRFIVLTDTHPYQFRFVTVNLSKLFSCTNENSQRSIFVFFLGIHTMNNRYNKSKTNKPLMLYVCLSL